MKKGDKKPNGSVKLVLKKSQSKNMITQPVLGLRKTRNSTLLEKVTQVEDPVSKTKQIIAKKQVQLQHFIKKY